MNIIITAPKHLGKSTAISKLLSLLPGKVSGFITEFIDRESDDRVLKLRNIDGTQVADAVTWVNKVHTVDFSAFDSFAPGLIELDSNFIVIDELGKFEKNCENLRKAVEGAFDSDCHVIASVRLDAAGWMQELKNRSDVLVITLDYSNRDSVPDIIANKLCLS